MYIYIYIYFFFFSLEIISIFLPDIKERCDISFPLSGSSPKILKFLRDICAKRAYRKKRKSLTQVNARFHDQWKNLGGIAQDICALFDIASMLLNTADTAYLPPPPPPSRRTGKRRKAIYGRIYEADSLFVPDLPTVARSDRDIAFEQFVVERGVMKPHRPLYRRNRLGCQDDISRKTRAF
jgi:hypothetical protein